VARDVWTGNTVFGQKCFRLKSTHLVPEERYRPISSCGFFRCANQNQDDIGTMRSLDFDLCGHVCLSHRGSSQSFGMRMEDSYCRKSFSTFWKGTTCRGENMDSQRPMISLTFPASPKCSILQPNAVRFGHIGDGEFCCEPRSNLTWRGPAYHHDLDRIIEHIGQDSMVFVVTSNCDGLHETAGVGK
jgi:hypothetical protein